MLTDQALGAYLERIGLTAPVTADQAGLRELHQAHLRTVPFENLSIHLSEPISLDDDDLIGKIVTRRRGGFCYELNGAFALLLEALGATVGRVGARVYGQDGLGPPFDHLALIVTGVDGTGPWLADVGFGSHSDYPLRLDDRAEQVDPAATFQLTAGLDGDVEVAKDGAPQYLIERRERALADFVPTCWWQQTSPNSHFRASTICSRLTSDGRISISGHTLIRTSGRAGVDRGSSPSASTAGVDRGSSPSASTAGVDRGSSPSASTARTEENLPTDAALLAAYRDHFGLNLDKVPTVT